MRSNAVHFRGVPEVVRAYSMNDMPSWSIKNGPCLMYGWVGDSVEEGENELRAYLELLKKSGTESTFRLCVYDDLPKGRITESTEVARSFNFSLFNDNGELSPYHIRAGSYRDDIEKKLDAIEKRLAKEESEEPEGIMGMLSGMMDNPKIQEAVAGQIIGLVGAIRNKFFPVAYTPGAVAGIDPGSSATELTSEEAMLLSQALAVLKQRDPQIGTHLYKVALIAQNDPGKYNLLIGML